ncbi:MAG: hypothetical protein Q4F05_13170, partial [bacterium]|nr:hypothetical protein [bacterium]
MAYYLITRVKEKMMKNIIKKIILLTLCATILVSQGYSVSAQASQKEQKMKTRISEVEGINLDKEYQIESNKKVVLSNLIVSHENGRFELQFKDDSEKDECGYNGKMRLITYPVESAFSDSQEIVGVLEDQEKTEGYELICFRIENNADSITLMEENLELEGHLVLNVAIKNLQNQKTIYFQEAIDDFSYTTLITDANKNKDELASYDEKDLDEIHDEYLFFDNIEGDSVQTESKTLLVESEDCQDMKSYDLSIKNEKEEFKNYIEALDDYKDAESSKSRNLLGSIPDRVFKTGYKLDTWFHSSIGDLQYSHVGHKYAGTDNRLTYIVVLDWTKITNYKNQSFESQLEIIHNKAVLYNVYNNKLGIFSKRPLNVNNLSTYAHCNTTTGCFNKRTQYAQINESTSKKIAKCIIEWVPYASTAYS